MKPINFEGSNFELGKPEGTTDDLVRGLPCQRYRAETHTVVDDEGNVIPVETNMILSCWDISDEDLENIQKFRKVWVNTWSDARHSLFPFAVFTFNEEKK